MPMPGRNGHLQDGGWQMSTTPAGTTGNTGVLGSLPQDWIVTDRLGNTPAEYVATNTITFVNEFSSGGYTNYIAYIDKDGNTTSGAYTTDACSSAYRYGFNGKENDKDLSEGGQDYGLRIYDSRLSRFLSVDPLTAKYPELTPYQFASNTPIQAIDLDGAEALFVHGTGSNNSTWDKDFMKSALDATGWSKIQKFPIFKGSSWWSGGNSRKARQAGANNIINFLLSNNNPFRDLKHVTLIGHSHGGNVNKLVRNHLIKLGWTVDIINIETPQRPDYQSNVGVGKYDNGKNGVYLNFYNSYDAIQFLGSVRVWNPKSWITSSRIDKKTDDNIKLNEKVMEQSPFCPGSQWLQDFGGHSLHNNLCTRAQILDNISRAFIINETKKSIKEWKPVILPAGLDFMNYSNPSHRTKLIPIFK